MFIDLLHNGFFFFFAPKNEQPNVNLCVWFTCKSCLFLWVYIYLCYALFLSPFFKILWKAFLKTYGFMNWRFVKGKRHPGGWIVLNCVNCCLILLVSYLPCLTGWSNVSPPNLTTLLYFTAVHLYFTCKLSAKNKLLNNGSHEMMFYFHMLCWRCFGFGWYNLFRWLFW